MPAMRLHGHFPSAVCLIASGSDDYSRQVAWQALRPNKRAKSFLGPLPVSQDGIIRQITPYFGQSRADTTYCRLPDRGQAEIPAETLWNTQSTRNVTALDVEVLRIQTYAGKPQGVGPLRIDVMHSELTHLLV